MKIEKTKVSQSPNKQGIVATAYEKLKESDCWSVFERHAFHGRNASEYPNLASIGKKIIVEKCGALPLAVKTTGNLLRRKFSQHEWVKILETNMWCLPALRLSYHNLPSNLKRCFSYCSIFPKAKSVSGEFYLRIKGDWVQGLTLGGLWTGMDRPFHLTVQVKPTSSTHLQSSQPAHHVLSQHWFDCSSQVSQLSTSLVSTGLNCSSHASQLISPSLNIGLIVQVKSASSARLQLALV
ncbi:NB-ARC domain disease resistance protein [Medicago truncatula]|uniref:NB-ARC domain disease resistance protein n=1 Tax=Medicago truncatula TaxID=3880 RepID=A0A072UMM1_MEDTR|nr:NB-ARC domain disease resistance protein [Medicago truncatula]